MLKSKQLRFTQLPPDVQGRLRDELSSLPGLVERIHGTNLKLIEAMRHVNGDRDRKLVPLRSIVSGLIRESDPLLRWMQRMILDGRLNLATSAPSDQELHLVEQFLQKACVLRMASDHLFEAHAEQRPARAQAIASA